jgi:hypothetical protein
MNKLKALCLPYVCRISYHTLPPKDNNQSVGLISQCRVSFVAGNKMAQWVLIGQHAWGASLEANVLFEKP